MGGILEDNLLVSVPDYSSKYISIRRFLALPRAVELSPIGLVSAKPLIVSLPFCRLVSPTRKSATEAALAAERSKFDLNVRLKPTI